MNQGYIRTFLFRYPKFEIRITIVRSLRQSTVRIFYISSLLALAVEDLRKVFFDILKAIITQRQTKYMVFVRFGPKQIMLPVIIVCD